MVNLTTVLLEPDGLNVGVKIANMRRLVGAVVGKKRLKKDLGFTLMAYSRSG
jgi:hypothetical protein